MLKSIADVDRVIWEAVEAEAPVGEWDIGGGVSGGINPALAQEGGKSELLSLALFKISFDRLSGALDWAADAAPGPSDWAAEPAGGASGWDEPTGNSGWN